MPNEDNENEENKANVWDHAAENSGDGVHGKSNYTGAEAQCHNTRVR